jgi:NAD(P)-dependent dehydrogenase (short-subunit alcohol dehydrogenase family)
VWNTRGRDLRVSELRGRVVAITGASSGIGEATALACARAGASVALAARRTERIEALAGRIEETGGEALAVTADVGEEQQANAFVARTHERFGRLDVLVNNAGVGIGAQVGELQTKHLDMQLAINLRSIMLFYRECMPMLKAAAEEHHNVLVVNTSSISGKHGEPWLSVYSATKHGVVGWTEAMNKELGSEGIKSTALCPAFVDTPMTDFVKEQVPADEMIRPEDIAEAVRYLLRVSPACVVPEMMFVRPGDSL